jgi:hypothetical protein
MTSRCILHPLIEKLARYFWADPRIVRAQHWLRYDASSCRFCCGLGLALFLVYIEAYVLAVSCLLCIGSLAMISAITALSEVAIWQGSSAKDEIDASR